jgi:hypothetical protein
MAWLATRLGNSLDPESREKMESVVQMLDQAMTLKRRVVESLRPSLLDHFGLAVALRSHFDEHCNRVGMECMTTLDEEGLELDSLTQLSLFRVAQEALANIIERGSAKNVELVIEREGDGYVMVIGDDGAPADLDLARSMPRAISSGVSSRDLQQDRHELIDLAHLVQEVVRASRHAALAHGRQIVVRQHDDPHVVAVTLFGIARARGANDTNATAGSKLHIDDDCVVGHRLEFLHGLGFGGRKAGDLEGSILRQHAFEPAAQQRRIFDQQDAQWFARRPVGAHRITLACCIRRFSGKVLQGRVHRLVRGASSSGESESSYWTRLFRSA